MNPVTPITEKKSPKPLTAILVILALVIGFAIGMWAKSSQAAAMKAQFMAFQQTLSELSPEMAASVSKAVSASVSEKTAVEPVSTIPVVSDDVARDSNSRCLLSFNQCKTRCSELGLIDLQTCNTQCDSNLKACLGGSKSLTEPINTATSQSDFNFSNTEQLKIAQTLLQKEGFYLGVIDGKFGNGSKLALQKWQAKNNLSQTGIFDVATQAQLNKLIDTASVKSSVTSTVPVKPTLPPKPVRISWWYFDDGDTWCIRENSDGTITHMPDSACPSAI